MFGPVLDFVKNGDVYELPPMSIPSGPKMLMLEKPADYINFNRGPLLISHEPIKKIKGKGCAREKKKRKEITREDVQAWLIGAVRAEAKKKDTAFSDAFKAACLSKLGREAMMVVSSVMLAEVRKSKKQVLKQTDSIGTLLNKAQANGWLEVDGPNGKYWMKASPISEGTNKLHLGKSVSRTYMSQREQARYDNFVKRGIVEEEVHCG